MEGIFESSLKLVSYSMENDWGLREEMPDPEITNSFSNMESVESEVVNKRNVDNTAISAINRQPTGKNNGQTVENNGQTMGSNAGTLENNTKTLEENASELKYDCDTARKTEQQNVENSVQEMSEKQILKNILFLSCLFHILFTSYTGLANLQSSLHLEDGMGVITQSVLYATMTLSCLVVPKLAIGYLGHKWTVIVSMIGYILWMAANGYAVWVTMVIGSILVGLCAAPLWTASKSYLSVVARKYAELRGESSSVVNARFFGIFYAIYKLSKIISG